MWTTWYQHQRFAIPNEIATIAVDTVTDTGNSCWTHLSFRFVCWPRLRLVIWELSHDSLRTMVANRPLGVSILTSGMSHHGDWEVRRAESADYIRIVRGRNRKLLDVPSLPTGLRLRARLHAVVEIVVMHQNPDSCENFVQFQVGKGRPESATLQKGRSVEKVLPKK